MKSRVVLIVTLALMLLMSSCNLRKLFGLDRHGGGGGGGSYHGPSDFDPSEFGLDEDQYSYQNNNVDNGNPNGPADQYPQQEIQLPQDGYNPQQTPQVIDQSQIQTPDQNQGAPEAPPPAEVGVIGQATVDENTQVVPPALESSSQTQLTSHDGLTFAERCLEAKENGVLDSLNLGTAEDFSKRCEACNEKSDEKIKEQKKMSYYADFSDLKKLFEDKKDIVWNADWPQDLQHSGDSISDELKIERKKYLEKQMKIVVEGEEGNVTFPGIENFNGLYDNSTTAAFLVKRLDDKQDLNIADWVKEDDSRLACLRSRLCPMESKDG